MNAIAQSGTVPESGPKLDNRRILAALIDLAVVTAPSILIGLAAGLSGSELSSPGATLGAVMAGWALYYYFALESGGGQTLGKKVMKLRVVRVDGRPLEMGDVAIRTVLRLVDGLFVYLVGLVVMLATGKRRARLGDLAAKTMVVAADASIAEPPPPPPPQPVEIAPERPEGAAVAPVVAAPAPEPVVPEPVAMEPEPVAAEPVPEPVAVEPGSFAPDPVAAEPEPEPFVVEPEPEPFVVEPEPEPFVVEREREPFVLERQPEPEPVAVEPEPVAPEPVEPDPVPVSFEPEPVEPPAPRTEHEPPEGDEPEVTVKPVETVSAIDLVMGGDDPAEEDEAPDSHRS